MLPFSERYGFVSPRESLQLEAMDDELRVSIFNLICEYFGDYIEGSNQEQLFRLIWTTFWHERTDEFPHSYYRFYDYLHEWIAEEDWYAPYDLLEAIAQLLRDKKTSFKGRWLVHLCQKYEVIEVSPDSFQDEVNGVLMREASAYRMISCLIAPIINEDEISTLELALSHEDVFAGPRLHISKALSLFANRKAHDYENVAKEAVSAVEAAARVIVEDDKAELGKALSAMKEKHLLHPALIEGWKKFYGFASDGNGIRHASRSASPNMDAPLAKYLMITCSAFINYLAELYCGGVEDGKL